MICCHFRSVLYVLGHESIVLLGVCFEHVACRRFPVATVAFFVRACWGTRLVSRLGWQCEKGHEMHISSRH